eukprot:gene25705-11363_t
MEYASLELIGVRQGGGGVEKTDPPPSSLPIPATDRPTADRSSGPTGRSDAGAIPTDRARETPTRSPTDHADRDDRPPDRPTDPRPTDRRPTAYRPSDPPTTPTTTDHRADRPRPTETDRPTRTTRPNRIDQRPPVLPTPSRTTDRTDRQTDQQTNNPPDRPTDRATDRTDRAFENPEEADFFYVPTHSGCLFDVYGWNPIPMWPKGMHGPRPLGAANMIREAAFWINKTFPYFNRKGGKDHIWLMPHDEGACYAPKEIWPGIVMSHWGRLELNHTCGSGFEWVEFGFLGGVFEFLLGVGLGSVEYG